MCRNLEHFTNFYANKHASRQEVENSTCAVAAGRHAVSNIKMDMGKKPTGVGTGRADSQYHLLSVIKRNTKKKADERPVIDLENDG